MWQKRKQEKDNNIICAMVLYRKTKKIVDNYSHNVDIYVDNVDK